LDQTLDSDIAHGPTGSAILVNLPALGLEIAKRAGTTYNPLVDVNFCRVDDGEIVGGVVFTNYTGESISIHMAGWSKHWINRDLLYVAFDYPFVQLGVKRLFGMVPENNALAIEMNLKLGFNIVTRVEGVYPGDTACIVMRMDRENCRFLGVKPRSVISKRTVN
jgi:hypothetical protein